MRNRICVLASWVTVVTLFGMNCPATHAASRSVKELDHWYQAARREVRHWYDDQCDLSRQRYVAGIQQLNLEQVATIRQLRGSEIGHAVRGFNYRRKVESENYRCLQDDLRCAYQDRLERLEARYLAERRNLLTSSPYAHNSPHDHRDLGGVPSGGRYLGEGHVGRVPPVGGAPEAAHGGLSTPWSGQLPHGYPVDRRPHSSSAWDWRGMVSGMLGTYLTQSGGFRR